MGERLSSPETNPTALPTLGRKTFWAPCGLHKSSAGCTAVGWRPDDESCTARGDISFSDPEDMVGYPWDPQTIPSFDYNSLTSEL